MSWDFTIELWNSFWLQKFLKNPTKERVKAHTDTVCRLLSGLSSQGRYHHELLKPKLQDSTPSSVDAQFARILLKATAFYLISIKLLDLDLTGPWSELRDSELLLLQFRALGFRIIV
jgi:hypothetical protein